MKNLKNYKNRFYNLMESTMGDVKPLVNEGDEMSEQIEGGETTGRPYKFDVTLIDKPQTLRGDLFKTGSSEINKDSNEFKNAVKVISSASKEGYPIEIIGGASSVGSNKGYDNKALATRRAQNFIKALKETGINGNFKISNSVVGNATERDSAEALQQQFVRYIVREMGVKINQEIAIDNTATKIREPKMAVKIPQDKVMASPDKKGYFDLRVTHSADKKIEREMNQAILKALEPYQQYVKKVSGY
jgi:outer membrane protein OmpA-like peptidoglycan-associated protein